MDDLTAEKKDDKPGKGKPSAASAPSTAQSTAQKVKIKNAHPALAGFTLADSAMGEKVAFPAGQECTREVTAEQAEYLLREQCQFEHENGRRESKPRFARA